MKSSRHACGLLFVLFSLVGCEEKESTVTKPGAPEAGAPESVFAPMLQTIEKAKTVEDLSANRTRELDKELEQSQ